MQNTHTLSGCFLNLRSMRTITTAALLCWLSFQTSAQQTPKRTLLALSKADHTLALVDPATLKIIARPPVGSDPHEVVASADGTKAYVTIYGGGAFHEIDILDLVAQKALTPFDTKPLYGPHGATFVNGK